MSGFFNRCVTLEIVPYDGGREVIRFTEGLRITFRVERTLYNDPNIAECVLYNLRRDSRDAMLKLEAEVRLYAGYGDPRTIPLLSVGDMTYAEVYREGVNVVTRIEFMDGFRALNESTVRLSFPPGATPRQALSAVASEIGLPVVYTEGQVFQEYPYASGVTFMASPKAVITEIVGRYGSTAQWSVQNGALVVNRQGGRLGSIPLISPSTGMIDVPRQIRDTTLSGYDGSEETDSGAGVRVRTLLRADIGIYDTFELRSEFLNGQYKVTGVSHDGDTRGAGDSFTSTFDAEPVND